MRKQIRLPLSEESIDLERIKSTQLDILDHFKSFCDKNHLLFYLCGGTTLGAVRHQGFIPWDDDIDVMMPRKDYDKFLKIYKENANFFLQTPETDKNYHFHYAKLLKSDTVFLEYTTQHIDKRNGIFIDIFPIDNIPISKLKQRLYFFIVKSLNCRSRPKYLRVPGNCSRHIGIGYYLSRILYFWCSRHKAALLRDNYMRKHSSIDSKKVINGLYFAAHDKTLLSGVAYLDFEGRKMPVPSKYKQYLTECYGDYNQLPPVNERVPHHYIVEIKYC